MKIDRIRLDIDKKLAGVIPSVQWDNNTRYLHINVLNGTEAFNLSGYSVKVAGLKPDGTSFFNDVKVINASEGFIEVVLTEQMNAAAGSVRCELKLYNSRGVLSTQPFIIYVETSITPKGIVSSNEFKALTDALIKVGSIDTKFESLTEATIKTATEKEIQRQIDSGKLSNMTIANGSITQDKLSPDIKFGIEDGEVDYNKTTFFKKELVGNLFDKSRLERGYIQPNGSINADDRMRHTAYYIEVKPGITYTLVNGYTYSFAIYNSKRALIRVEVGVAFVFTMPSDAKYVKVCCNTGSEDKCMFLEGNHPKNTPYIPYGSYRVDMDEQLKKEINNSIIQETVVQYINDEVISEHMPVVTSDKTDFMTKIYYNYIDDSKAEFGIVGANNSIWANNNYRASDYIPVREGVPYVCSPTHAACMFYDENKKYTREVDRTFTPSARDKYVRITYPVSVRDTVMFTEKRLLQTEYKAPYTDYILEFASKVEAKTIANQLNKLKDKPLEGKKWIHVGDSISDSSVGSLYPKYVSEELGLVPINYGGNGTGWLTEFMGKSYIYNRLNEIPSDVDYITIMAGVNDRSKPLGALGDTGFNTVYGAIEETIKEIVNRFYDKKVGIILPIPTNGAYTDDSPLGKVVKAIKEICDKYQVPVLDLFHNSGIYVYNSAFRTKFIPDGLHPNEKCHKEKLAPKITDFIKIL